MNQVMFVGLLHLSEQIVFMPAVNQHQEVKYASVNSHLGFRPQNEVKKTIDFFLNSSFYKSARLYKISGGTSFFKNP